MAVERLRVPSALLNPPRIPSNKHLKLVGILAAIFLAVVIICPHLFSKPKIDANGFPSPWDTSLAPPQYLHPSSVKIVQKPSVSVIEQKSTHQKKVRMARR